MMVAPPIRIAPPPPPIPSPQGGGERIECAAPICINKRERIQREDSVTESVQSPHPTLGGNCAGTDVAGHRGGGRSGARANRNRSPRRRLWRWRDQDHHRSSLDEGQHGSRCDERGQRPPPWNNFQLHRRRSLRAPHAHRRRRQRGRRRAKKNWQLWVNTSYADRGFGAYEVQPLDVVFWRFTTQE